VPEPDDLLDRLRSDRPFAYARLPHGFWESVWMLEVAEKGITSEPRSRGLSPQERRALAERFCASVRWRKGTFAPLFIDESLADVAAHAGHPDFFRAVAFRGSLAVETAMAGGWPPRDVVLALFARHYRPDETLYDAMIWKRWLIRGQLRDLPGLCLGHPVVLVANHFFATLGRRWKLDEFDHVQIPPRRSHWQRWPLLERVMQAVQAAVERGRRPPVVLLQCGGSLANWLITRLFARFPGVFYLDLGQALDGWFLDVLDEKFPQDHGRMIIESCRLEQYYRERKKGAYAAWLKTFK
jgi:hypothetical protein